MEYVYAALLLHSSKQEINEENLKRVLEAAKIAPDEVRVKSLVAALAEVNIEEALKGAAVMPLVGAPAPAAAPTAAPEKKEKKEEEKEEEPKKEEEALEGLGALFG
ncbi:MAG: 50S ribosomal protein P1 [Candidatus Bathyarchaeia archaeon]